MSVTSQVETEPTTDSYYGLQTPLLYSALFATHLGLLIPNCSTLIRVLFI